MKVANEIKGWLGPYCSKIAIAGSLRRKKAEVGDIEILAISWQERGRIEEDYYDNLDSAIQGEINAGILDYRLNSKDSRVYGPKNKLLVHCASGIPVDIFSTTEENWWVALVVRTGSKESNIRICMEAKK